MADPKIIYVPWTDWESGKQFLTDQHTQVRVARAAIPIIFVPGIMGTRLKKVSGGRAWDPDDTLWMLHNYFRASGKARMELLTKDPLEVNMNEAGGAPTVSFTERLAMKFHIATEANSVAAPPNWDWLGLPPNMSAEDKVDKTIKILIEHGWDQVAWGFYEDILCRLAEGGIGELGRAFIHPIYAFGYNWIGDNYLGGEKLAKRITEIITKENFANHPCDRVILISHSMGGLVTRSCVIHNAGAKTQVLGIIHGAQPATGAPAAYRRMRGGFEQPDTWNPLKMLGGFLSSSVLGINDERVTPILANCVGGLELLPTPKYKTNSGEVQWLTMSDQNHKVVKAMPNGDVYEDVYWSQATKDHPQDDNGEFLRLILHPSLLHPGSSSGKTAAGQPQQNTDALKQFHANLTVAKDFINALSTTVHQNTYVTYTGHNGPPTFDKIHFSYTRDKDGFEDVPDDAGGSITVPLSPLEEGAGTDLDQHPPGSKDAQYFSMDNPSGAGDGTVPVSSSRALIDYNANVKTNNSQVMDDKGKLVSANISSVEHGAFFSNSDAIKFTVMAIRQLDWKYRFEKIGK